MDNVIEVFPHIAAQIFQQLDDISLTNCREVVNTWKQFIDNRNLSWMRIIEIPTILSNKNTAISPGHGIDPSAWFLLRI